MLFKHFYDPGLAQGSYLIGCQRTGEAIVVDARRDIQVYLDTASSEGLRITAVTETHIHADYLSGSRELAHATGAQLYLSDEGDANWKYGFEGHKLYHHDEIQVGNIIIKAVHTPGHTPEHLSFLVTDGATADEAGYYLTGDFVFVGDIGRPDLLDEAAGGVDTRFLGAAQMFQSLKDHFLTLPDYVQVWPAHGAGSACGKALGAIASTTVGYERKFAWWATYIENDDIEGFTKALLEGQPDAPLYFGRMKMQNKQGPALLGERPPLQETQASELNNLDKLLFIDTRPPQIYAQDAFTGAINIPAGKSFSTFASYVIDPLKESRNMVLLAKDQKQAEAMRDELSYVGIDKVTAYVCNLDGLDTSAIPTISPSELEHTKDIYILDVRTANEYHAGHIPKAHQLHAGRVMWRLDSLPTEQTIVTHCQSGARNAAVSSSLRAHGFRNVVELEGSYLAWLEHQDHQAALV